MVSDSEIFRIQVPLFGMRLLDFVRVVELRQLRDYVEPVKVAHSILADFGPVVVAAMPSCLYS